MTGTMGEQPDIRFLDADELKARRKGKRVVAQVSRDQVLGTQEAEMEPEIFVPNDPAKTFEMGKERVFKSFLENPDAFRLLCDTLRVRHPAMAHLANEQLKSIAFAMYDAALRRATDEAFRNTGREHELTIKVEGF